MLHKSFHYNSINDVTATMRETATEFPLSENFSVLGNSYDLGSKKVKNRILFQPMEASDSEYDGSPGELTYRRYERYAKGGPGIIWVEAVAIANEARAGMHQLYMTAKNLDPFKRLTENTKSACMKENGFEPILIMQSTHAGRYSKNDSGAAPLIAANNPLFEKDSTIPKDRILSDDDLKSLVPLFGESAKLAVEAGFDGIDIKACHRYLINELLCAHTREGSYGGSFENRIRLLLEALEAVSASITKDMILTTRLNVYDGFPYPYGFGVSKEASLTPDLSEPLALIGKLKEKFGMKLINITAGNPYVNPHVTRPYDNGNYVPDEHPFEGVSRITGLAATVQKEFPDIAVVCSGLSYLRRFSDRLAAGMIESGAATFAGFGRMTFAYPDFPKDIIAGSELNEKKVCMACGQCTKLLRAGKKAGCVIRDREAYSLVDM